MGLIETLGIGNVKRLIIHPTSCDQIEALHLRQWGVVDATVLKRRLKEHCQKYQLDIDDIKATYK